MKFHVIVKIGVSVSVLLFCIAVGFYSFASLKEAGKGKDIDIFSMIPDDSYSILETDNIDYYVNEFSRTIYFPNDTAFHSSGLLNALNELNTIASLSSHGISNKISRIVLSTHNTGFSKNDVIAYFKLDNAGKKYLLDLISKKYEYDVVSKSGFYRGKRIDIYSLGKTSKFLSVFSGDGFMVISYHKRLIESVIDALVDETSVRNDSIFSKIEQKKTVNYMTFYSRETTFPALSVDSCDVWSEFELRFNSDIIYLNGAMYQHDNCLDVIKDKLDSIELLDKDSILVLSGKERIDSYLSRVVSVSDKSLFEECVSNLSRDASYIMVADMAKVEKNPDNYKILLPKFIMNNLEFFSSFIMSLQINEVNGKLSHIYVFTYKY